MVNDLHLDEKQITWQSFMEAVTEDCLQDNDLEQVEPFGPSPIQNDYITAATLEQMRQAQGSVLGDWSWVHEEPDWEIWHLDSAPGQVVPASIDEVNFGNLRTSDIKCGVDPAGDFPNITVVTEFYRDQIVRAFGVPADAIRVDGNAFTGVISDLRVYHHSILHNAQCTPSRNLITERGDE